MRVELPYAVRIPSPHGDYVMGRDRQSRLNKRTRYFATKEEAVAFCGNEKLVLERPGEAWKAA
jgi:hypothetical protein